ncbi:MAG: ATP-binding protein [Clostridia bacterium]|nr:ATP-binding protein [Clostridia bacterium]
MNKRRALAIPLALAVLAVAFSAAVLIYSNIHDTYASAILQRELDRLLTIARDSAKKMKIYIDSQRDGMEAFCAQHNLSEGAKRYKATGSADELKESVLYFTQDADNEAAVTAFIASDGTTAACYSNSALIDQADLSDLPLADFERMAITGSAGVFEISPGDYALALIHGVYDGPAYLGSLLCAYRIAELDYTLIEPSYIGNRGYIAIQSNAGLNVLHPAQSRIGVNVLQEAQAEEDALTPDERELRLTQYGRERGKAVYHSRLWQEEGAPECVKLTGYARTSVGEDFLIVNAVNLYDEVIRDMDGFLAQAALLSGTVALILLLGIAGMLMMANRWMLSRQELQYFQDLTALREAQRRQNEQMRHHQQMNNVGMFVSGIAHEFNNQLTTILIDSDILSNALAGQAEWTEWKECAEEIYHAGMRGREFVSQLLLISKKDRPEENRRLVSMDEAVRQGTDMIRRMLPEGIRFELACGAEDCSVYGSERQIGQILMNLCTNAIQAMKGREGTVRVCTRRLDEKTIMEMFPTRAVIGDYVCLSVEDQGAGMDEQTISQIFDPFFTTKPGREGTGLGLTLLSDMVESMNGWCAVSSVVSKGSRFDLFFPCASALPAVPAGPAENTVFALALNIIESKTLEHALSKKGWKLVCFDTHGELLRALYSDLRICSALVVESQYKRCDAISVILTAKRLAPELRTVLLTQVNEKDTHQLHRFTGVDLLQPRPVFWEQLASWIAHPKEENP